MNKAKLQRYVRKSHRYLGVLLGIQFLFWTIGGLYFSWTKIEEVRGENLRKKEKAIQPENLKASIANSIQSLAVDSVLNIKLALVLDTPHYQVTAIKNAEENIFLINAIDGKMRKPVTQEEAMQIAVNSFTQPAKVVEVKYLTSTDGHHEYREKPLPAYAITLDHPTNTTVYVSENLGTVQSFRNNQWRVFDFLWMLHVMDFEGRDNINNWLLRIFSAFGLVTLFSGFALFILSSSVSKKKQTVKNTN